jgi:periplasmic protein TonB
MMTKSHSSKLPALKYWAIVPVFAALIAFVSACQKELLTSGKEEIFSQVDVAPEFNGGMQSMFKYLGGNIKYPKEARESKTEGTVYVSFIVEKDGSLSNLSLKRNIPEIVDTIVQINPNTYASTTKIVKRQDQTLGAEAMRVISAMPKWTAGKKNGKAVRASYVLPIKFKLE